ncbi:PREDICTED: protein S100-A10-like [Chrysochloris asiatica]|uniref:Protein S100-A10 n=1 Tax=Chrysochloris asiatica TaxID=185453 RepID=A0A9B0U9V0_CHRAS|nr:PREDICTED: protein S100-A10-like [Chrysochloris asiatica]
MHEVSWESLCTTCQNTADFDEEAYKRTDHLGLWKRAGSGSNRPHQIPSQMELVMETMMFTFHKFAGDKCYLMKEDLRVLMEKEFPRFLENQKDPLAMDKIRKDLNQYRDGKVGFQSFLLLIVGLTITCNNYSAVHMKRNGKN